MVGAGRRATVGDRRSPEWELGVGRYGRSWRQLAIAGLVAIVTLGADAASAAATEITEYPVPNPAGRVAAGPDGNVWFAMGARSIGRMAPDGTVAEFAFPAANVFGMTAGPDGAMWLSGKDATYEPGVEDPFPATIYRVTTAGGVSAYTLAGSGTQPNGITVGPDGALWFAYMSTKPGDLDHIGRITTSGTASF